MHLQRDNCLVPRWFYDSLAWSFQVTSLYLCVSIYKSFYHWLLEDRETSILPSALRIVTWAACGSEEHTFGQAG